jgi:methyl-accepting chemotaxis protein
MRVEISYKFMVGFIIVVGSIVLVDVAVPHLGIPEEWQQLFTVSCAMLVGLVLGSLFSKAFTANIRVLREAAGRLSQGDLSRDVRLRRSAFPDEVRGLQSRRVRVC